MTSATSSSFAWGILGAGQIAGVFARGVAGSRTGRLVAVGSRDDAKAAAFAAEHRIPQAYGSYEALLADPDVQAVYIATPHPQHVEWVVRAAEAGKHVLVEKPIGLNHAEAMVAAEACRAAGVVLMEAWMYRCHPQTARVVELVRSGALGTIGLVQAAFSFNAPFAAQSRIWSNAAGGGGILDVGGYPVSYARLIAGATVAQPFLDPESVSGAGYLHPETGVDVYAAATLRFRTGLVAQVSTGVGLTQENVVRIYGTKGWLLVPSPFVVARDTAPTRLVWHREGVAEPEEIVVAPERSLYSYEADALADAVAAGQQEVPAVTLADTLGNMAALDAWRAAIGLVYAAEQPEAFSHTITRRPLARRASAPMRYGEIPGVARPVSRLIMGCDNQRTMPHAAAVWDDYFERGGNTFDTAYIYGGGVMERLLGSWLKHRGVREQVVVIGKGAHPPYCTPEAMIRQLEETLARLQTDYVDLYLMHRDNPAVPVGEFVDVLDEQVRAGRIRVFGGSNWSFARIAAANRYAKRKGRHGFGAVSNNFSLARMVDPVWGGCLSASDLASRRWLKKTQLPLLAWSSQARGFFTERAAPERLEDPELVRCWYSEDNFARRERAMALARQKGVTPIAIAAAYVLAQPFPTFALIGPRTIGETVSSLSALAVELNPREVAWLNLERDRV